MQSAGPPNPNGPDAAHEDSPTREPIDEMEVDLEDLAAAPSPAGVGARIEVELANGEHLSLRFPSGQAVGGGTCECDAPTAELSAGRRLVRARVFTSVAELLGCLFTATVNPSPGPGSAVDLDPVPAPDPGDTIPEGVDYLGSYSSIPAYLKAMLEPEVTPACAWILDHLDYVAVQRRWEGNCRLMIERGHVYRLAAP